MSKIITDCLYSVPWWVWAGMVVMLIAGGYMIYEQGIVYGGLFFVGGILTLWADFRDRNPTEQEALATEEGLTSLNWLRWIALIVVALTIIYGLYVAQAPSSVFLGLFAIESVIRYSDQLFPDEASSIAVEDTATESSSQSRETTSSSADSETILTEPALDDSQDHKGRPTTTVEHTTSEPVLDRERAFYVSATVGMLTYAIGWIIVIPRLFLESSRPSNSALTVGMGVIAVVAYGLTSWFIQDWLGVLIDQDRFSEHLERAEESRAYRLLRRYWFGIFIALILVLFVILTKVL